MTDEDKKEEVENGEEETPESKPKKGGMMKIIMFGGIGVILLAVIGFGVMFFLGGSDEAEPAEEDATEEVAESHESEYDDSEYDESDSEESDDFEFSEIEDEESIAEMIENNLAFLDYEPDVSEMDLEDPGMTEEDSMEVVNWADKETARLKEWETRLAVREKELNKLDDKITQQIHLIDQVKSTRVSSLAKLYDNMDSRSVAKLMANLDDETIVSILPRMKIKTASVVLSLFPSKRAARLSKRMITIAEK